MRDEFIRSLTPEQFAAWRTISKMNPIELAQFLAYQFEANWHDKDFVITFRDTLSYDSSTALQQGIEGESKYV
jgi:hypothetical protein